MLSKVALLLTVMVAIASAAEVRRLGCFVDSHARDLPTAVQMGKTGSRIACQKICTDKKFRYFGLQAREWCFCGNTFGRNRQVPSNQCNLPCSGDAKVTCGGHWRNEIFTTGIDTFTSPRLGCFIDRGARDLPELHHAGAKMTRQYCLTYCKGKKFKFFGLQAGSFCLCGNTHGKYGKAPEESCYHRCAGDKESTCGGHWRNEIYTTGL